MHPQKWEQRFHKLSDPEAISQMKSRRVGKEEDLQDEVPEEIITDEGKLHSLRAFRGFLESREGYEPPSFLKKALNMAK